MSLVFVGSSHVTLLSASTVDYRGEMLTRLGHEQLQQGEARKALQTWSEAYEIYRSLNNSDGINGSLINQSLALQALGSYPRACQTLIEVLKLENQDWICSTYKDVNQNEVEKLITVLEGVVPGKIQILGLQNLGNVLRLIGKSETSEIVLKKSLSMTKNFSIDSSLIDKILLSLGNTEYNLYKKEISLYKLIDEPLGKQKALEEAKSRFNSALNFYQQVSANRKKYNSSTKINAELNLLDILLNSELRISQKELKIQTLIRQLSTTNFRQLAVTKSIYNQIKFSTALIQIASNQKLNYLVSDPELSLALSNTLSALEQARKVDNTLAESLALGTLSKVYNYLGKVEDSKECLEKALSLAQSIQSWDIAYQWQRELGRVYKKAGRIEQAKKVYASAIKSIEQIQSSNLLASSEFEFAFKSKIEPVYQEYLDILFSEPKPNFKKIIQIKEKLQISEIKNFLQCNHLPLISQREINQNVKNTTPTIYILKLKDKVKIIVRGIDGFYDYTQNLEKVTSAIHNIRNLVQSRQLFDIPESSFLFHCQNLYNLLIAPIKEYLPIDGSLVFIVDTYFQDIPFALMHNGKNYLIDSYNISTSITSSFLQPTALTPLDLKVVLAGISQTNPAFKSPFVDGNLSPLPEVKTEIASIKRNAVKTLELMDGNFTAKHFQQVMGKTDFPIVHVSSHGQFSSDPSKTFILAWDKPINVRQIESLIKNHKAPIELLVLSACQTAKGDKRSALGIAGVAVMAGARSTLATLWLVDAESTAQLMGDFYKGLKNGLDESQALRQAQLTLAKNPKYSHPYYWAPFILVTQ